MKKIRQLIPAILITSLLIGGMLPATAVSEQETITDGTNDIIDALGEIVESSPYLTLANIDITQLTYNRVDTQATLTLTVDQKIENRGSLADLLLLNGLGSEEPTVTDFNINSIGYFFTLSTDNESYYVFYVNNSCQIQYASDPYTPLNLTSSDFSVVDDTLTINFELNSVDEIYESVAAQSSFIKMQFSLDDLGNLPEDADLDELMTMYTDDAPNPPLIVVAEIPNLGTTTGGAYLGTVGSSVQFNGTVVYGQPPYTSYMWTFGDGSTSSELNPTHTYTTASTYTFNFTVTDSTGASESQTGSIVVSGEEPNGGTGGTNLMLLVAIIVIIVIIGIVVIVWIIRR